jgi:putative signal transducing protein
MTMKEVKTSNHVICLITAPNTAQAQLWREALGAEGIESQVVGDFPDLGSGAASGISPEIWIKREDWVRAKLVLRHCSQSIACGQMRSENATA